MSALGGAVFTGRFTMIKQRDVILLCINVCEKKGSPATRRELLSMLREFCVSITQQTIDTQLQGLKRDGFIAWGKKRKCKEDGRRKPRECHLTMEGLAKVTRVIFLADAISELAD